MARKPAGPSAKAAGVVAKMGRPTTYLPEYCDAVVEMGKKGYSRVQIADALALPSRSTLDDWAKVNPEFSEALTRAKMAEQAYWERLGHDNLNADKFQAVVWKTAMASRFREDYQDRRVNEMVGKDGGPIQTEARVVDAGNLSAEEREAARALLLLMKGKM